MKSTVTITGAGNIGGIAGQFALPSATIQDAYFNGAIRASGTADEIGGIVGRAIRGQYIKNSYSAGTIIETGSNAAIGGIWGYSVPSFAGYPAHDFSAITMSAAGTNEKIGGLFGFIGEEYSGYADNFWDVTATGRASCSAGGVTSPDGCNPENTDGTNSDYFKNNSTNGPLSSWDFGDIWKTVADGYPELSVMGIDPAVASVTPMDGAAGISASPELVINFSEPMDTSSLVMESSPCSLDGCLSYDEYWSNGNQTATLTPTTILLPSTTYHIELFSVLSAGEFSLANPFAWSFTTAAPIGASISGGRAYICTDPKAINYDSYPATGNASCEYFGVSSVVPVKIPPANQTLITAAVIRTLRYGSRGSDVMLLQKYLNAHNYSVAQTGLFGPLTKKAVLKFQKDHGLPPDGIAGPKTRALMI